MSRRIPAEPDQGSNCSTAELDLVVAGTKRSVLMVESEAHELSEEIMLGAVMFGHREMQPVIDMIVDLAETAPKNRGISRRKPNKLWNAKCSRMAEADLRAAYKLTGKQDRSNRLDEIKAKVKEAFEGSRISTKKPSATSSKNSSRTSSAPIT